MYLAGTGRSGSTVLANLLGSVPGLVSVGELRFVWHRGVMEDRPCGCGRRFSACPFWQEVLGATLGPTTRSERVEVARGLHARLTARTRLRTLPRHLAAQRLGVVLPEAPGDGRPVEEPDAPDLDEVLARLYRAVREVSGCAAVVDSSKLPTYLAVLAGLEQIDPTVVHLVRDPRAAAHSWRRRKPLPELGAHAVMERRGAVRSALLWTVWNASTEALSPGPGRYARLTYEQLVAAPADRLDDVFTRLGIEGDPRPIFGPADTARIATCHTVAGNPVRHQRGSVRLTLDDEWRSTMTRRDQRVVTALTTGVAQRYGYR